MTSLTEHKTLYMIGMLAVVLAVIAIGELLYIKYNGSSVPAPNIPRKPEVYGSGRPLTYAVLGDSTTISQGGDYDQGYARESARHLAQGRQVTLRNFGVSGARAADVKEKQAPEAAATKPDVVLIAVSANDVTHLTSLESIRSDLQATIRQLREANPEVVIVLTGAAAMGSVPRFPEPVKSLAGLRTDQINKVIRELAQREAVTFAPVAEETGPAFAAQADQLFAADKFHPNTQGYKLWTEVINDALSKALSPN